MADVFDLYVKDNRTIQFKFTEPIMLEDSHVTDWVFHIPRILNNLDVSGWAWWLVYINARGQKYSELLELSEDPESPLEKCIATYSVDYGMSIKAGIVRFSLEAINTDTGGEILNEWHTQTYQAKVQDTLQGNQVEYAETESDIISALIVEVQNKVRQLVGGATPEPKSLIADMTDTKKVYLYVGSETGESTNYWYYHNGSAWVAGGVYASGITVDSVPTQGSTNAVQSGGVKSALDTLQAQIPQIDPTLSQSGQAADAKVTGDKITELKEDLNYIGYTKTAQPFNDNAYINTKVNVGSTVSTTPVSSSSYAWSMASCSEGDRFLISGQGGDTPRFWAFTDDSYKLIDKADNDAQSEGLILVAPADGYIIINSTRTSAHALYALTPASVQGQIDNLVDNTGADMYVDVGEWVNGSTVATNGSIGSTVDVSNPKANSNFAYVVIEVAIGDILRVTAYGGSAPRAWAFTDASYKLISQAASGRFADDVTLTAPANGYLICNSQKTIQDKLLDYRVLKKTLVTAKVKFAEVDETIVEKASTDIGVIIDNWLYKSTIQDNVSVGDTVTTTPVNSSQYASMIVACSKDDKYIITGTGGASALLWAFTDTSYKLLSKSGAGASERDLLITASANGYLIVNVAYNYDYLLQKVTKVETADALDDFKEESYPNPFVEIIMPSKIRVCGGVEMSIYYKSILRYMDAGKVNLIAPTGIGYLTRYKDFCRITPADNANSNFNNRINVYVANTKVADIVSDRHRIDMIPKTAGNGLSKKVLLIGDSLTDADVYSQKLYDLFDDDMMDITFLGTRDTNAVPNEGYSAWRAYTFAKCANATDDGIGTANVNPFYNATAEQFDFSYYMTQQGYTGVDYVFICLGVNDLAKNDHFNDFTDYYDILIDSIHDYDPTIRIGIWLPPCRGLMANADRTAFDRGLYADKKLIEVYDGRESELIYLVPVYLNVDPDHDFNSTVVPISTRNPDVTMTICTDNVHPANSGYYKIADVIYSYIKYFGSLDV